MRLIPKLMPFLCCLGTLTGSYVHAQQTDTLRQRMSHLLARYREHSIADTEYLKGVDSIAPMLGKEDSIAELLSVYQQLTFAEPSRGKYRAGYYT